MNDKTGRESGQALIVGVMLFVILLITIPALIILNQVSTHHNAMSQQRLKGRAVADQGVAFGVQQLSQLGANPPITPPPNWPYLSAGAMPLAGPVTDVQGNTFKISYSSWSNLSINSKLQSYQVGIMSRPEDPTGKVIPGSSVFAVVSQRTVGAKLPNGYSTSGALLLMSTPCLEKNAQSDSAGLAVHWGPVILLDNFQWTCRGVTNLQRFPRKFAPGDITGATPGSLRSLSTPPLNTDNKEYWANSSLGFANVIDLQSYQARAQAETGITAPSLSGGGSASVNPACTAAGNTSCGDFIVPTGQAVFSGYNLIGRPNVVIFIEGPIGTPGDAVLKDVGIDIPNGALIVTGNLTFGDIGPISGPASGNTLTLRVPPNAGREYPYYPATPTSWPCRVSEGGTCPSTSTGLGRGDTNGLGTGGGDGLVQFRGFIYVQGNFLSSAPTGRSPLIVGAMRVDGFFNVSGPYPRLSILYDDQISHSVRTSNFELQVDSMTAVP